MPPVLVFRARLVPFALALGVIMLAGAASFAPTSAHVVSDKSAVQRQDLRGLDEHLPGRLDQDLPQQEQPEDETFLIYLPLQVDHATLAPPTSLPTQPPSATPAPTPSIVIDGDRVLTDHYELRISTDRIDKQEFGRLLEAYYPQAVEHFGAAPTSKDPDGRLIGEIYHDDVSYQAALARRYRLAPGSGGYYAPWLEKFYLFVQPSRHYSRQLTLHEATHQMQSQAGGCKLPGWWAEGEPEYLGMHTWDGISLQTQVIPPISLEDYPAGALSNFESKGSDIGYIVRGESGWVRKEGWGIIAYLFDTRPEQAEALRKRYCAGEESGAAWAAVFGGPVDDAMNSTYHAWLLEHQQPWQWVWNTFEPDGPNAFKAFSGSNAIAVLKQVPRRLEVDLGPSSEAMQAGIMFNYRGTSDFTMLRLNKARKLSIIRVEPGWNWSWKKTLDIPPRADDGLDTMRIDIEHPITVVYVNDQEVASYTEPSVAEGQVGLNLEGSAVRFRVLDLKY
jgi:hypothetical protein